MWQFFVPPPPKKKTPVITLLKNNSYCSKHHIILWRRVCIMSASDITPCIKIYKTLVVLVGGGGGGGGGGMDPLSGSPHAFSVRNKCKILLFFMNIGVSAHVIAKSVVFYDW